jgi:hypothetical protein
LTYLDVGGKKVLFKNPLEANVNIGIAFPKSVAPSEPYILFIHFYTMKSVAAIGALFAVAYAQQDVRLEDDRATAGRMLMLLLCKC